MKYVLPHRGTLAQRIRTLMILRLLAAALFLFASYKLFELPPLALCVVILAICFLTLIYALWLLRRKHLHSLAVVQIAADLVLETAMVYYTGGLESIFVTLYVLSILSAAVVLSPRSSLVAAGVSSVAYLLLVGLQYFGVPARWAPLLGSPPLPPKDPLHFLYMGYVNITIFWIVGFLSAHLSRIILRMEQQMKMREKLSVLGELIADIAHEIRNPLATIAGALELLKEDMGGVLTADQSELFQAVANESDRLQHILNRILDYVRSEEIQTKKFSLTELLDEVFLLIEGSARLDEGIRIEKPYRAHELSICADRQKLKQVFLNLIHNALEAMRDKGVLTVEVSTDDTGVSIAFRDTGPGMDPKTLRSLFIPFRTSKPRGTGIGLAIAYRIVASHGGQIEVESQVGKGSSFIVSLPAA